MPSTAHQLQQEITKTKNMLTRVRPFVRMRRMNSDAAHLVDLMRKLRRALGDATTPKRVRQRLEGVPEEEWEPVQPEGDPLDGDDVTYACLVETVRELRDDLWTMC